MSDNTPKEPAQPAAPRNPFAGTGIMVTGLVRTFSSSAGKKDNRMYHDLFLTTAGGEVKISLRDAPDPLRFQIGSLLRIPVMIRSWGKGDRSGMMLVEAAA